MDADILQTILMRLRKQTVHTLVQRWSYLYVICAAVVRLPSERRIPSTLGDPWIEPRTGYPHGKKYIV